MRKERRRVSMRVTIMLCAIMLMAGGTINGSLAWFVDSTSEVKNTFTVGSIGVTLNALSDTSTVTILNDAGSNGGSSAPTIIPGYSYKIKDTTVTITKGSEKCYLFAEIDESIGGLPAEITENGATRDAIFKDYISYELANGWIAGNGKREEDGGNGVPVGIYYRIVDKDEEQSQSFEIIKDNEVVFSNSITSEMLAAVGNDTTKFPTLSFSAYAVQYNSTNSQSFTPGEAWAILKEQADAKN